MTIQDPGLRPVGAGYAVRQDGIAAIAFWYQQKPHAPFPVLPVRSRLDID